MHKKRTLMILILLGVLLIGGAGVLYKDLSVVYGADTLAAGEPAQQQARSKAPDFTVTDENGQAVSLSDYAGKPVVLNFWASWCGPCKHEMPDFEKAYRAYGDDVHFLMVNMTDGARETADTASAYVDAQGFTFPVLFDSAGEAAIAYGVMSIPSTYFIDAQGGAAAQGRGALDLQTIEKGIDMITS